MGCGNNQPQQSMAQQASSMPTGTADVQTNQMISNYQAMKNSGIFNTPYQNAMKNHPFLMGLSHAAEGIGQGLTKQPFFTGNQENQASLQNTNLQGMNGIATLPAQMRMMMAMNQMNPNNQQIAGTGNVPSTAPATQGVQQAQWSKTPSGLGYRVIQ